LIAPEEIMEITLKEAIGRLTPQEKRKGETIFLGLKNAWNKIVENDPSYYVCQRAVANGERDIPIFDDKILLYLLVNLTGEDTKEGNHLFRIIENLCKLQSNLVEGLHVQDALVIKTFDVDGFLAGFQHHSILIDMPNEGSAMEWAPYLAIFEGDKVSFRWNIIEKRAFVKYLKGLVPLTSNSLRGIVFAAKKGAKAKVGPNLEELNLQNDADRLAKEAKQKQKEKDKGKDHPEKSMRKPDFATPADIINLTRAVKFLADEINFQQDPARFQEELLKLEVSWLKTVKEFKEGQYLALISLLSKIISNFKALYQEAGENKATLLQQVAEKPLSDFLGNLAENDPKIDPSSLLLFKVKPGHLEALGRFLLRTYYDKSYLFADLGVEKLEEGSILVFNKILGSSSKELLSKELETLQRLGEYLLSADVKARCTKFKKSPINMVLRTQADLDLGIDFSRYIPQTLTGALLGGYLKELNLTCAQIQSKLAVLQEAYFEYLPANLEDFQLLVRDPKPVVEEEPEDHAEIHQMEEEYQEARQQNRVAEDQDAYEIVTFDFERQSNQSENPTSVENRIRGLVKIGRFTEEFGEKLIGLHKKDYNGQVHILHVKTLENDDAFVHLALSLI